MNQDKQPEALRLADICATKGLFAVEDELRRLHARVQELEAAQAQRVPLTDEKIEQIAKHHLQDVGDHWCSEPAIPDRNGYVEDFVRAIERAHGITQEKQG